MNQLTTLPLFNWNAGIIGAIIMFAVFLALIVALFMFLGKGKKRND